MYCELGRWVQNMRLPCFLASIQHKYFFPRRAQRPLRKWGPSGDLEGVGQQRRPRRAPSGNWPTPQMQVALKVPLITQRFGAASGAHDPPSSGLSLPMLQCPTDKPEHIRTEECTVVHNVYLKVLIPLSSTHSTGVHFRAGRPDPCVLSGSHGHQNARGDYGAQLYASLGEYALCMITSHI